MPFPILGGIMGCNCGKRGAIIGQAIKAASKGQASKVVTRAGVVARSMAADAARTAAAAARMRRR